MSDHEFYAQPTVFDRWHASIGSWLRARFGGLGRYSWVISFGVLGFIFLVTAMAVLVAVLSGSADSPALPWNDSMAKWLTVLVGLTAAQTLFRQALDAWPVGARLPTVWRRIGRWLGWRQRVEQRVSRPAAAVVRLPGRVTAPKSAPDDRQAVQAFFSGVRTAGVNVAIAKALFGAGIRSPQHLLKARDEQLCAIHGVGPATVRKLRSQFQGQ